MSPGKDETCIYIERERKREKERERKKERDRETERLIKQARI